MAIDNVNMRLLWQKDEKVSDAAMRCLSIREVYVEHRIFDIIT